MNNNRTLEELYVLTRWHNAAQQQIAANELWQEWVEHERPYA